LTAYGRGGDAVGVGTFADRDGERADRARPLATALDPLPVPTGPPPKMDGSIQAACTARAGVDGTAHMATVSASALADNRRC